MSDTMSTPAPVAPATPATALAPLVGGDVLGTLTSDALTNLTSSASPEWGTYPTAAQTRVVIGKEPKRLNTLTREIKAPTWGALARLANDASASAPLKGWVLAQLAKGLEALGCSITRPYVETVGPDGKRKREYLTPTFTDLDALRSAIGSGSPALPVYETKAEDLPGDWSALAALIEALGSGSGGAGRLKLADALEAQEALLRAWLGWVASQEGRDSEAAAKQAAARIPYLLATILGAANVGTESKPRLAVLESDRADSLRLLASVPALPIPDANKRQAAQDRLRDRVRDLIDPDHALSFATWLAQAEDLTPAQSQVARTLSGTFALASAPPESLALVVEGEEGVDIVGLFD